MRLYALRREQLVKRPRADVFRFFESPGNLELITPASVGFNILTPQPIAMHPGTVLDYTIRLFGLSVRWTTIIASYNLPASFSDVAIKGPYRFWHHAHRFDETPDGTVMIDEVRYALPFGPLGRLAHVLWVKRQLRTIFDYRARRIAEVLDPHRETANPAAASKTPSHDRGQ